MEGVEKGNKVKVILTSAICLGLIIMLVYSSYLWKTQGANPIEQVGSIFNKASNGDYAPPVEPGNLDYIPEDSAGGGGSGNGGGGSGGSSSGSLLAGCSVSSILYSLEDITKKEVCNSYVDEICVDKTISCSAEIHNREPSSELFFVLELSFVENEKSVSEAIERRTKELSIAPSSFEIYNETLTIQSSGADGIANNIINCFYNTAGSPTKEC